MLIAAVTTGGIRKRIQSEVLCAQEKRLNKHTCKHGSMRH